MIRRYSFATWSATCGLVILGCAFAFRATTVLASTCAAPNLQTAGTFSAGSAPVAVMMGDFNADGKLDLAVANKFSANVSILLGKGDGTFLAAVNYAMGSSPSSVATGDLNGDGRLDLAVTDAATGTVWIRLGVGDGTFLGPSNYVVGDIPQSVAISDFNGDGKLDLAVANRATADVSVLLGKGDGTFLTATNYAAGVDPLSIAVGDFNQDHKLDLVVANAAIFDDPPNVSVFLGNGDGTFQAATNYAAGISPRSVAVGDLNGDSKLDLAVANHGIFENGHFTNSSVSVLLGNGNGTFQSAVNYTAGEGPLSVAIARLNMDNTFDLAVLNDRSATVSLLAGLGDGTFQPAANSGAGANPASLAVGTLNGDSRPDLAVANNGGILVLINSPSDNVPPQINCPANITVNAPAGACTRTVTFSVTATDNCTLTNLVSVPASGFAFPVGTTTVTNTAQDSDGNTSQCTFTVTVNDTQPPVITCPANITVNAAAGVCTRTVTFSVTATDNCAVTNVVSVPASGFAFPVGTTIVTNTAWDRSGNSSQCTFTVTVHDTQPPVISCPANITVNAAPGQCTSNVTFGVTATDNCAVTNLVSVPASGFSFPAGTTTTVTSTARDSSGNSSQCTFTVTVVPTPMSITDQPSDVTACNGGTATFTAAATGTLPIAVRWQANTGSGFTNIPNATSTTLSVPANPSTVGSYRAVFSNPCGTNTSAAATLTLGTSLSCSIDGPNVICPNSPANTYSAPGFNAYQWSISGDGSLVGPVNNPSVVVSAGPSGILTLTVQVTDSTGCIGDCSKAVTIQDTEPPVVNCPTNITVNAAPGQCASNVVFSVTATDNCVVTNVLSVPPSGFAFPVGTTTVTNTARDSSGNSSQCTFTVTVLDTQPPLITCPANITVNAAPGECSSNVTFNVTATDNCAVTSLVSVPPSGFAFPVGVTTVTNTARDSSGNSNRCTFTVTVNDDQPPLITCPANITVNAPPGECSSNVTFNVTATDNCAVTSLVSVPPSGFAFPVGVTTVTNTARDSSGNSNRCTFTVTVLDTQPPLITCPANITVNAAPGQCSSNVIFSVTATDNCEVTNVVSVPASGFAFPVGTTTVTSTAHDSSGNTRQCTFKVTVIDTQRPVITCPANITVNAAPGRCTSNVTFSVTATDNCAVMNVVSVPASGFAFPVGTTVVTSTATDSSGNTSQCTFSVTVIDSRPPMIDCPADITVNAAPGQCTSNVTFTVTATDDCPVASLVSEPPSGFAFPVGTTTVTSTARDSSGNSSQCTFTVTVHDTQPPVVPCPANITTNTAPGQCSRNVIFSVTATDNCAVTNVMRVPPSGFAFPVGTTTVTNIASDSSGNSSQCTFTVTVVDNEPPVITCPANITVNAAPGQCVSNVIFSVTATDSCAVTSLVSVPPSGFAFPIGTTTVTNTARDSSGNSNRCTFTVTVLDTQPPLITCPANITVNAAPGQCTSNVTFNVTATDNCAVTSLLSVPPSGFAFPVGITTVTNTARDSSGNSNRCTFTVTVNDTQPPLITCPANITVNAAPGQCSSNVTFNVTATDNCAVTSLLSVPPSGFAFPIGITTVTNTARDSSGNSNRCTFTVTVNDTQPPLITCPADITVNTAPGACTTNVTFNVTATDNCAVTNVLSVPASGFAFPVGTTTVTGTARDSSGNSSQCSFSVTVIATPMNITDQPSSVTACPGGTATFIAAATGTLPITVVWQVDHGTGFTNIPNATNTMLTVPADPSTAGSYRAVFTNPCGSRASASATLSLGTSLSCSIDGPDFVCPNATAITYQAQGFKAYQWSISGDGTIVGSINAASVVVDAGPSGSFTLNLQVTDSTSCIGSCSKVALIRDSDAPVISCPANITVNAAPGECSSNVTFNVTATDNCAVTSLLSFPPSGFAFPVGITTVTNIARDSSGNSNRCTFTVTVLDTQPPLITCPANITVNAAPGECSSNVTFNVTATDNCAVTSLVSVPPSGFAFPVGTTTVTNTARDGSGNSNRCTFTVTVVDTQLPVLSGLPNPSLRVQCLADVPSVPTVTANDNCDGNVTVIFTPTESGDVCNRTISRTWSAMDTSGNTTNFTQTIIVHDDTNPILIKGTIATSYATVAEAKAAALAATDASDNCSAVTKTVSTVGDCPVVITVTGTDACGNHESVSYNTCVSVDLRLAIVRNDTSVTVSWPFPSTGFVLESTTNLSPANWQPVAEAPMVNNGRWEVTLPIDQQQRYLRLHKP